MEFQSLPGFLLSSDCGRGVPRRDKHGVSIPTGLLTLFRQYYSKSHPDDPLFQSLPGFLLSSDQHPRPSCVVRLTVSIPTGLLTLFRRRLKVETNMSRGYPFQSLPGFLLSSDVVYLVPVNMVDNSFNPYRASYSLPTDYNFFIFRISTVVSIPTGLLTLFRPVSVFYWIRKIGNRFNPYRASYSLPTKAAGFDPSDYEEFQSLPGFLLSSDVNAESITRDFTECFNPYRASYSLPTL